MQEFVGNQDICKWSNQGNGVMRKIRNIHVNTTHTWQYDFTQGCFLYLNRPLFDLCITGFASKFFERVICPLNVYLQLIWMKLYLNAPTSYGKSVFFPWYMYWSCKLSNYTIKMMGFYFIPCFTNCMILT